MPWFCWFASGVFVTLVVEGLAVCVINWWCRQTD